MASPVFQHHTSDDAYLQLLTSHGPKEWAENPEKHPKVFGVYRKIITNILNHRRKSKEGRATPIMKPQKVFFTTSSPKIAMDNQHLQQHNNEIPTPPGLPPPDTSNQMDTGLLTGRPRKSPLSLVSWRPIGGNSAFEDQSSTLSPAPTPPMSVDHIPYLLDSLRHAMVAIEELQKNMDCTTMRDDKIHKSPRHSKGDKTHKSPRHSMDDKLPTKSVPMAGNQLPTKMKRKAPSANGHNDEEPQSEQFVYGVPITSQ